jgi:hypothetical protein
MSLNALNAVGSEQLTVEGTAVNLTGVTDLRPTHALIQVTTAPIRWLAGGTTPTATKGIHVDAGGFIEWLEPETNYRQFIENALFIRETGTSAVLEVIYIS